MRGLSIADNVDGCAGNSKSAAWLEARANTGSGGTGFTHNDAGNRKKKAQQKNSLSIQILGC